MGRHIASVAVLGCGTMGSGIAAASAAAGCRVLMLDITRDAVERGLQAVDEAAVCCVADVGIGVQHTIFRIEVRARDSQVTGERYQAVLAGQARGANSSIVGALYRWENMSHQDVRRIIERKAVLGIRIVGLDNAPVDQAATAGAAIS